jgi:heptaprenyl diphosphate synthase
VLYALAEDRDAGADPATARLREILAGGAVTDEAELAEALGLLRESAALKRTRETVRWYAERARAQLTPLPSGPARSTLASLCDMVVDRTG